MVILAILFFVQEYQCKCIVWQFYLSFCLGSVQDFLKTMLQLLIRNFFMLHGIYWTIISRVLRHSSLYSKPVASPPIRIGVPSNKETNAIQMMTFKFFLNSIFWKLAWEAIYSRAGYCERLNFKMGVLSNKYQHFFLLLSPSPLMLTFSSRVVKFHI